MRKLYDKIMEILKVLSFYEFESHIVANFMLKNFVKSYWRNISILFLNYLWTTTPMKLFNLKAKFIFQHMFNGYLNI